MEFVDAEDCVREDRDYGTVDSAHVRSGWMKRIRDGRQMNVWSR